VRGKVTRKSSSASRSEQSTRHSKRSLPVFVKRDFLTKRELRGLTKYVLAREPDFTPSSVIPEGMPEGTNDPSYRKSRVLYDLGEYGALIQQRVLSMLPDALKLFNREPFELSHIDIQVTASNDRDFFKVHNDNGHNDPPEIPRREISFVHYFNAEPKAFTGGHLRFYDSQDGLIESSDDRRVRTIIPRQNTLVIFPSSYSHEVLPVSCPSGKFAHSRFTANGWFVRQDPTALQAAYGVYGGPTSDMTWLVDAVKALSEQLSHPPHRLYITLEEASEFSGLSLEYLVQLIQGEQLKAVYDGGWKVRRADIENL
jgi:Rps23 Pro-64 3,4-dihydroxylase Tpa1-like proline 4-hydroxylase